MSRSDYCFFLLYIDILKGKLLSFGVDNACSSLKREACTSVM